MNPYDWQGHHPQILVPSPQSDQVLSRLLRGGGVWVLAGRGMGKSVFLAQLELTAANLPEVTVVRVSTAPPELSYHACLGKLASTLNVSSEGLQDSGDLVARFQEQQETPHRLIFLFDEFDRYCREPFDSPENLAGRDFFNDLENTRKEHHVGILAAGGIGSFVFRDVLGSSFLSRAQKVLLDPFELDDLSKLANPFVEEANHLPSEVLDLLMLSTGGNPALLTYGLEQLWEKPNPGVQKVVEIFENFQQEHRQYLWTVQKSFGDERLSGAPERIWEMVRQSDDGRLQQSDLRQACRGDNLLALDFADVIDLLQAAGLVRLVGSVKTNPVSIQPLASILSLAGHPSTQTGLAERFYEDLESTLMKLHILSADFFQAGKPGSAKEPGNAKSEKRLVQEVTFAGVLALGFLNLGWQVEREAQYGAGRTDLMVSHPEIEGRAVIEVKIWRRNDYKDVQQQVESYWSVDVVAGAVIMLTDRVLDRWPDSYRSTCLDSKGLKVHAEPVANSPIQARFSCGSRTPDGLDTRIDHFLLRIVRR